MSQDILTAEDIEVFRGNRQILRDISLSLRTGELSVLIGPNGAGKSTLIDVLTGEQKPDSGRVLLHGKPLEAIDVVGRARKRAVMAQENSISFAFTVEEVVEMGRQAWAKTTPRELDEQKVMDAIAAADISHLRQARITEISGGERQRTAFARLLAQDTALIFLDEPVAAMDIRHQEQTLQTVRSLCAQGATAMVVLHDLSTAAYYADQLFLLSQGRLISHGKPPEVCDAELLSEVYQTRLDVQFDDHGKVRSIVPNRSVSLSFV